MNDRPTDLCRECGHLDTHAMGCPLVPVARQRVDTATVDEWINQAANGPTAAERRTARQNVVSAMHTVFGYQRGSCKKISDALISERRRALND